MLGMVTKIQFLVLLLYSIDLYAVPLNILQDSTRESPAITEIFQSTENLAFKKILILSSWEKYTVPTIQFGYSAHHFWFRMKVKNAGNSRYWFLNLSANQLDNVDFYIGKDDVFAHFKAGDKLPFTEWSYPFSSPTLKFHMEAQEEKWIYIHVKSESVISFQMKLYSEAGFAEMVLVNKLVHWSYFLIFLFSSVFLIYMGNKTGNPEFYFLIVMTALFTLYTVMISGNTYPFWPDFPWLQDRLILLVAALFLNLLLLYVSYFLRLKEDSVWMHYIFMAAFVCVLPLYFSAISLSSFWLKWLLAVSFVIYPLLLLVLVQAYIAGKKYAINLLVLCVLIGGSLLVRGMTLAGWLPYNLFTYNSSSFMFPVVVLLIVKALYDKYANVIKEKEHIERDFQQLVSESREEIQWRIESVNVQEVVGKIRKIAEMDPAVFEAEYTIRDMAKTIGIRSDQLSQVFSQVLKTNFPGFLKTIRIHKAIELIENYPDKKMIDIAFESGFGSKAAFNEAFKKIMNLQPSDFRKRQF